jgi:hypothetical protein
MGQPLDFSANEDHSFQEWLQLSRMQPIIHLKNENSVVIQEEMKKNLNDRSVHSVWLNLSVKHGIPATVQIDINREDNSSLMTET